MEWVRAGPGDLSPVLHARTMDCRWEQTMEKMNNDRVGSEVQVASGTRVLKLSTHYYVLSLSERTSRLYEAFRDTLIDIENTWFPLESSRNSSQSDMSDAQLQTLMQRVDHHFAHYYGQEPLGVVLAGTRRNQSMFMSLTAFSDVIIGQTAGDHSATSVGDLGNIVWPIVKGVMAHSGEKVELELEIATLEHNIAFGIDAVVQSVDSGVGATLLVEEGYRVTPPESLSLVDDADNVVDVVIDKVLALGGNVIFVEDRLLSKFRSIALILQRLSGIGTATGELPS
jgi:Bacterial archaeo-eukaryotic release factor family 3